MVKCMILCQSHIVVGSVSVLVGIYHGKHRTSDGSYRYKYPDPCGTCLIRYEISLPVSSAWRLCMLVSWE